MPNSGFDRINASFNTSGKYGKRLTVNGKVMYSNEKTKNRPWLSDSPGSGVNSMYFVPNDLDIRDLIGDPNSPGAVPSLAMQQDMGITIRDGKSPGEEYWLSNDIYAQNPYWAAYHYKTSDTRDRIISSGQMRFNITDYLYVDGTVGIDWYARKWNRIVPQGTGYRRAGQLREGINTQREVNLQAMLGFNKVFGKIGVNAFVGGARMRANGESVEMQGEGFNTPFLEVASNATSKNYTYGYWAAGINSVFGSAEFSYNDYLFITATARQDWFSVLNPEVNGILYPSIGGSFVFTDAIKTIPSWLSFGKVRASWAQVGNAASVNAYSTNLLYSASSTHIGRGGGVVPLGDNTSTTTFPNPQLKPFTSTETEVGFDIRLFNNRVGLDFAYYSQNTTDDILYPGVSNASGFSNTAVNVGKLTNRGIEFLLSVTPVKRKDNLGCFAELCKEQEQCGEPSPWSDNHGRRRSTDIYSRYSAYCRPSLRHDRR
ncbi:MAG: TonB-dependent receptor [Flavihumibacter sp.]